MIIKQGRKVKSQRDPRTVFIYVIKRAIIAEEYWEALWTSCRMKLLICSFESTPARLV
jgi:hypothetical protein